MQKNIKIILTIAIFWLLSTLTKIYATKNGNFPFWFDLGRDAIISREIIENKDLKIQGPSASGTNDSVFHGVLYYYMIGPLYTLFQGNPQTVLMVMTAFSSLSIVPIYLLSKSISKSTTIANLTGFLYIFSYEFYKSATWLSNPIIANVSLPFFFYFYWQVFFEKKRKYFWLLLLSLAITHQSVILFLPWWGLILLGFLIEYKEKNLKHWKLKYILAGLLSYLLVVSTMLLAQYKVWKAGIFNPQVFSDSAIRSDNETIFVITEITRQFFEKLSNSFFPSLPIFSIVLVLVLLYFIKNNLSTKIKLFFTISITSPLWLLSWHHRYAYHSFMTLELIGIIIFSLFIKYLWKIKVGKIIASLLIVFYIFSNIALYKSDAQNRISEYFVPRGAYLKEMLEAIDYTYKEAGGNEFSISTITNPYGYNTLWAYLYSWYGQKTYGYLPNWYGPDQAGIFGGNLLSKVDNPKNIHFSIREPNGGIPIWLFQAFNNEQENIATSTAHFFGTIELREHVDTSTRNSRVK